MDAKVIVDIADARRIADEWDALAQAAAQPLSAPAWMLAWTQHVARPGTLLRIVAVRDRGELVGVAPFAVRREGGCGLYSMLGGATGRTTPLAVAGREREVADATLAALGDTSPAVDALRFENAPEGPWLAAWDGALRAAWGRPGAVVRRSEGRPCPVMAFAPTYDEWMAGKSANFRSEMRRARRRFAEAGGRVRRASSASLTEDVATYLRLHLRRRGDGSDLRPMAEPLQAALVQFGTALPSDRLRLYMLDLADEPIGALLFVAAGREVVLHNIGWDERHAKLKPGSVGLLECIQDAIGMGDERLDFGPGAYPYKLRFATDDDPVFRVTYVRPRLRLAGIALHRSPQLARSLGAGLRR